MSTEETIHGIPAVDRLNDENLAAEARAGGRALTKTLAHFGGPSLSRDLMLAAKTAKDIDHVWSYYIDFTVASNLVEGTPEHRQARRDRWRSIALSASGQGNYPDTVNGNPERTLVSLSQAEEMFDWPIYRAHVGHGSRVDD